VEETKTVSAVLSTMGCAKIRKYIEETAFITQFFVFLKGVCFSKEILLGFKYFVGFERFA
jgi:hypothetical protein